MKRSFTLLLALCLTMATMWAQDYVFTFNRTAGTVAVADAEGNVVEGVTATIAVSPDSYLTADKAASDSILCINQNSASATADNPNRYTLIIKGLPEDYCVENVAFRGVALTGTGGWQGVSVDRKRYFKVSYNEVALDPSARHICNDSHCSGVPTNNVFELAESYSVAGNDLVVGVDIYNGVVGDDFNDQQILGCFYGLTAVTLSGYTMEAEEETDYTSYIANADLSTTDAWNTDGTKGISDGMVKVGSNSAFDFNQTITLPAGQYKMTAKAAYRYGNNTKPEEQFEYEAILGEKNTHLAKLYAETSTYKYEADVMNRWEGASETDLSEGTQTTTVVNNLYVPNSSSAVKVWFDKGQYVNELVFNVQEDGQVKIGIVKTETATEDGDYTNIGAWTLTRLGDAEADPEEEEPGDEPGDVTAQFLTNAGFDDASSWVTEGNVDQVAKEVTGWTMTTTGDSWYYGAAVGYGSTATVNNAAAPATNPEGVAEGGALGISVGWGCTVKYTQDVVLPAGVYTLTYKVYNANPDATQASNLFGFTSSEASFYGKTTNFTANAWTEESISFYLAAETAGTISVGAGAISGGSGANAKLFVDGVTLKYVSEDLSGVTTEKVDFTYKVGTSKEAWNATGGPVTIDGISMPEVFQETSDVTGDVMWQTVEGLENGIYVVELWANARVAWRDSPAEDGQEELTYLTANNVEISMQVLRNPNLNSNATYVLEGVKVTDGTMKIGMTKKAAGSNWHTIQIKSLIYTTLDAILGEAKSELQAAIDAATVVSPATDELTAAIAAAQAVFETSTSKDEFVSAATTLKAATTLAVNTNAVAGATIAAPVVTNFVVNGTFDTNGVTAPWKTTTKAQNQNTATNQTGAFTGNFFENWHPENYSGKIYQVIENIPNGLYELSICAFVQTLDASAQFIYANADKKALVAAAPTAYTVRTIVENNTIEVGFEQTAVVNGWSGIDNVSLKYYGLVGEDYALEIYKSTKAKAEALKDKTMSLVARETLEAALAVEVDETDDEALLEAEATLQQVITSAQASVDLYATNKLAIDAMYALMESTNVYTAEAFLAYKNIADEYKAQYEAGTLTATVDNPAIAHGWHATTDYGEMLLSAFGIAVDDWANLHINTWSVEGDTDGSEFKVPFYEYWTGDDQSLGTTTKTATVTGLTPDQYYGVEAWVRVRAKNGVAAADATGITLSVGEGTAVDLTEGAVIGTSQFSHAVYTAYGYADAEGKLTINFNVLDGNNVSWLSFKNLKYAEAVAPFADFFTYPTGEEALDELGYIELFFFDLVEDVVLNEEVQATLTTPTIVDDEYFVASVYPNLYLNEDDPAEPYYYINFECEEKYTEPGEYKLTIPEGLFTVNGAPNAATEVYFIVKESAPEFEPKILSVTPAEGEVTELSEIIVQFDSDMVIPYSNVYVTNEAGAKFEFEYDANHSDWTQARYFAKDGAITAAGAYTFDCSQIDHMNRLTGVAIYPFTGTYSWTIKAVDDGIDHLNADADAVIYDIHGRRVEKMTKGLYIVNGKKVVIK